MIDSVITGLLWFSAIGCGLIPAAPGTADSPWIVVKIAGRSLSPGVRSSWDCGCGPPATRCQSW